MRQGKETSGLVLVVEDNRNISEMIGEYLESRGFEVDYAADGLDGYRLAAENSYDAVVLDLMLPRLDGIEVCRRLRSDARKSTPVLMLTARDTLDDKLTGLSHGADDYLTKPFEGVELVLRVKALLKRCSIDASQSVQIGALTLDMTSYTVSFKGAQSDIPMKEFELLFKLGSAAGKTFARDQLIEDVWGYDFEGNERTLDVHINRLRERFPAEPYGFKITTVRGLGYRLEVLQ